jgi:hypothetical protein
VPLATFARQFSSPSKDLISILAITMRAAYGLVALIGFGEATPFT